MLESRQLQILRSVVVAMAMVLEGACYHRVPTGWSDARQGQSIRITAPASVWIEGASTSALGKRCKASEVTGYFDSRDGDVMRLFALQSAKSLVSSDSNCVRLEGDTIRVHTTSASAVTVDVRKFSAGRTFLLGAGAFALFVLIKAVYVGLSIVN